MRQRRRLWALLLALAVLLVDAVFVYWPWSSPATRENYDRIGVGMTMEEVEAILGPPDDYRNVDNEYDASSPQPEHLFGRGSPSNGTTLWRGDTADIGFGFVRGEDGKFRVSTGIFCRMRPKSDNPYTNMQWRAQRRWRRWLDGLGNGFRRFVGVFRSQPAR